MTTQAVQGATVSLNAFYRFQTGALTDPEEPRVDIIDPLNETVVQNAVPVREALGTFRYDFAVPEDAPVGFWRAEWAGIINDYPANSVEQFQVLEYSSLISVTDLQMLRMALGEPAASDPRALFSDEHVAQIWANAGNDMDLACLGGWEIKSGMLQSLIDISENGSERPMSKMFVHAANMRDYYKKKVTQNEEGRVKTARTSYARTVNLYQDPVLPEVSIFVDSYATYVRPYPTYRFPAILS